MTVSTVRLRAMPRGMLMNFAPRSPLSRCAPPNLPRVAAPSAILDGAALADRIAVGELWLDGDVLCAVFDEGPQVRVAAVLGDGELGRVLGRLEVTCSSCGEVVCGHGVAAILCAYGAAGTAGRLVEKSA